MESGIFTVHMWEDHKGYYMSPEGLTARRQEIVSLLGVMAGDKTARYDDTGYFRNDGFSSRVQRGGEAGFIGLATSPVTPGGLPIFCNGADTGLLLKNPVPVFVSCKDTWSVYYERPEDIPAQEAWDLKCGYQTGEYAKSDVRLAHSLLRDDPPARGRIAGKLCVFRTEITRRYYKDYPKGIRKIIGMQADMRRLPPYLLLDPLSPDVQQRAKAAYRAMVDILDPVAHTLSPEQYTEADVNATLEHVAGILAYNRGKPLLSIEKLEENIQLAAALYMACTEREWMTGILGYPPIITIYQPGFRQAPLLHFLPTPENRCILEKILKDNGYTLQPPP
jgi:hypothetical protein